MSEYNLVVKDERPQIVINGAGIQGPEGPSGQGLAVQGTLADESLLPAEPTTAADGWIINGDLYVWNRGAWANVGPFRGPQGPSGPEGPQGPIGPQGIQGPTGPIGPEGPVGPQGPAGQDGTGVTILGSYATEAELNAAHPTGTAGDAYMVNGDLYVWSATLNAWENVGRIQGPEGPAGPAGPQGIQGAQGIQGPAGPTGATGPAGSDGVDGDSAYQVAVTNGFVGTEAEWLASLEGPVGPTGPQGPQGPTGLTGPEGPQGPQGLKGDTGLTGPAGPAGPEGPQGIQGPAGPQGLTGATGPQGPAGTNGKTVITAAFNATGPLEVFDSTQRSYVANAGNLVMSKATLGTAGSTSSTIVIKKNGTTVHTLTIAASNNVITNNTVVAVAANDYITVGVTSAGTGASDLMVAVRVEEA